MAYLFLVSSNVNLASSLEEKRTVVISFLQENLKDAPKSVQHLKGGCRFSHIFSLDEIALSGEEISLARSLLKDFLSRVDLGADVLLLESVPDLRKPGLLIMDMDMTTVQIEGIDEIARNLGVYDEVAAITAEAMHGHLDFASSLRRRVAKLKSEKSASEVLAKVKAIMQRTAGLEVLLPNLKSRGFLRGIASGGFTQLISEIDQEYGLDVIAANTLEIVDDKFTGEVAGEIVDAEGKLRALLKTRQQHGISREQSIVIGDGANDLLMIKEAGLGIAYYAKPKVVHEADFALSHSNLAAVWLLLELYGELKTAWDIVHG